MPKQTFLNLPNKRQIEIINTSLKEFSIHNFETASINKIISELSIAKGSFYRYFKNKKDLYLFLLEYSLNKKIAYLETHIDISTKDFFQIYKSTVFNYMKFDLSYPIISNFLRIAIDTNYIKQTKILNSLNGKNFIGNLVSLGKDKNQIKKSLDKDFIIFYIINLSEGILNYIKIKLGISYNELLCILDEKSNKYTKELENIFNELIDVLTTGLKPIKKSLQN